MVRPRRRAHGRPCCPHKGRVVENEGAALTLLFLSFRLRDVAQPRNRLLTSIHCFYTLAFTCAGIRLY
jgi:hypothetical protein